jgi:alpha/beta superfamily hydrolase
MSPRREERAAVIPFPDGERALDGLFVAGADPSSGGAVIAPPHPLHGGSMESPVVGELAHACGVSGLASLRFDWRGVGASAGAPSGDAGDADEDFLAALGHLAASVDGALVAGGYSFGAVTVVRNAGGESRVRRLVLVAPPVALLDAEALAAFPGRVLVIAGAVDPYAPPAELATRVEDLARANLEVVPEADHFFQRGLVEISRATEAFLGG